MNCSIYSNKGINCFLSICICIGTLCFSPLLFIFLLPLWLRNIEPFLCCISIGFAFAFAAFHFEPDPTMDLAKYYNLLDNGVNILDYYRGETGETEKADFFILIVFVLIKSLGLHSHFLAAISAFIHFSLITYISILWSSKLGSSHYLLPTFIGLIFSNYILGFTGIRFENAVICMCISMIHLSNNNRTKCLIWLFLACMIHFGLLGIGMILTLSLYITNLGAKKLMTILITTSILFSPFLSILSSVLLEFGPIGHSISSSINAYTDTSSQSVLYAGSRIWVIQKLISFIFLIYIICSMIFYNKYNMLINQAGLFQLTLLLFGYQCFIYQNPQLFMRSLSFLNKYVFLLAIYLYYNTKQLSTQKQILHKYTQIYIFLFFFTGFAASISGKELNQFIFIPELI